MRAASRHPKNRCGRWGTLRGAPLSLRTVGACGWNCERLRVAVSGPSAGRAQSKADLAFRAFRTRYHLRAAHSLFRVRTDPRPRDLAACEGARIKLFDPRGYTGRAAEEEADRRAGRAGPLWLKNLFIRS